jgi:AraC family transcriptional regulator
MLQDPDRFFRPDRQIALPGVLVSVGDWMWEGRPFETVFAPRGAHIACLLLSARPSLLSGRYLLDCDYGEDGDVGELTFSPAGTHMHQMLAGVPQRTVQCALDPVGFEPAVELLGDGFDVQDLKACLDVQLPHTKQRMLQLAREVMRPGFGSPFLVESIAMGVLVDVARHLKDRRRRAGDARAALSPWQLRRIDERLNDLSGGAPTIADLAAECGVSRGHLSRLFKATTGRSVHEHVADVRLSRAKALLADTALPLKTIGFRLGFSSQSAFSFAFSQAVGLSPREYRRQFPRARGGAG